MLLRLIPSSRACRASGKPCERSIIVLRSATAPPCRALRTKNRSPASVRQSWRGASLRRSPVPQLRCAPAAEYAGRSLQKLRAPCRDLVRANIKQLRQLRQRFLPLHRSQRYLRLKCRAMISARSLAHLYSCHAAALAAIRQKIHLSRCAVLPGHLSPRWPIGSSRIGRINLFIGATAPATATSRRILRSPAPFDKHAKVARAPPSNGCT